MNSQVKTETSKRDRPLLKMGGNFKQFGLQLSENEKLLMLQYSLCNSKIVCPKTNKNAFQSKAHLLLADRKSNTYNLTLE